MFKRTENRVEVGYRKYLVASFLIVHLTIASLCNAAEPKLRLIIETDAGGDPDDEQSLVRLLVYANEFDIEGIIANRAKARDGENKNPVRDGLGIVQALVKAYGQCHANLVLHDNRFPTPLTLLERTVAGYDDVDEGVDLILRALESDDPRPVWFSNWGTDMGSSESCLKRALDRVLSQRGPEEYRRLKNRLRLSSADRFGEHTTHVEPPFPFWLNASHPPLENKRWYHRFSALTATAGGFNIERDVRTGHGPLGQLYPVNTGLKQKEGDTMMFLYLVPTGMNDPGHPEWGSWGGRYGHNPEFPGKAYYWANQADEWNDTKHRDNCLLRWASALQNDFAARMDWCVADAFEKANHAPIAVLNGDHSKGIVYLQAKSGENVQLTSDQSTDPDGDVLQAKWFHYPEPGNVSFQMHLDQTQGIQTSFVAPRVQTKQSLHVILEVIDTGTPPLVGYRRAIVTIEP